MTTLFVTQLDFGVTESDLLTLFKQYGSVARVNIVKDKQTNRSRGFAFVEMNNDAEAQAAIDNLNGYKFNNRACVVRIAEDRNKRSEPNVAKKEPSSVETPKKNPDKKNVNKKKAGKSIDNTSDGRNKKTKMSAHKKSGKKQVFIEDEDDLDEPYMDEEFTIDDISDDTYRAYVLSGADDD